MNQKPLIAPSVLSANFLNLGADIQMINQSQADWFHVDIMDGVFVPNLSFGFPVMEALKKEAQKPLDVHLMIVEPDRYISRFVETGAAHISVHAEACPHLHRSLQNIRQQGVKAGVALNPHTPNQILEHVGEELDLVILMSVNPGFGGQKFIENTLRKTENLAEWRSKHGYSFLIEIDGGVNAGNAKSLVDAGADVLVAGNFVFSSSNPSQTISELKALF
jgi:ribulose-phosphate 3-epimerase